MSDGGAVRLDGQGDAWSGCWRRSAARWQVPQTPCSQPMWVPGRPRFLAEEVDEQPRAVPPGPRCGWPLTVRLIVRVSGAMAAHLSFRRGRPPVRSRAAGRSGPGRAGSPGWHAGRYSWRQVGRGRVGRGADRPGVGGERLPAPCSAAVARTGVGATPGRARAARLLITVAVAVQLHSARPRPPRRSWRAPGELGERVPAGPDRQPDLGQDLVRRQGRAGTAR